MVKSKLVQKRSKNKAASILDTAKKIIDTEGIKFFNTNHIAKKSGVSIGSVYQYFQSKEIILLEIIKKEYATQMATMDNLFSDKLPLKIEEKLNTIIEYSFSLQKLYDYFELGESYFKLKQIIRDRGDFESEFFKKSKMLLESSQKISNEKIEQALLVIFTSIKNSSPDDEELKRALVNLGINFLSPQSS